MINNVKFSSTAWMKLKKADEIMRINGTPVWNLNIDQIRSSIDENHGTLETTLQLEDNTQNIENKI